MTYLGILHLVINLLKEQELNSFNIKLKREASVLSASPISFFVAELLLLLTVSVFRASRQSGAP